MLNNTKLDFSNGIKWKQETFKRGHAHILSPSLFLSCAHTRTHTGPHCYLTSFLLDPVVYISPLCLGIVFLLTGNLNIQFLYLFPKNPKILMQNKNRSPDVLVEHGLCVCVSESPEEHLHHAPQIVPQANQSDLWRCDPSCGLLKQLFLMLIASQLISQMVT